MRSIDLGALKPIHRQDPTNELTGLEHWLLEIMGTNITQTNLI